MSKVATPSRRNRLQEDSVQTEQNEKDVFRGMHQRFCVKPPLTLLKASKFDHIGRHCKIKIFKQEKKVFGNNFIKKNIVPKEM